MKLEVGKFYKTRDGRKAEVVYINEELKDSYTVYFLVDGDGHLISCSLEGSYYGDDEAHESDLVSEWKEPERVTGWMNIYTNCLASAGYSGQQIRSTKEEAEKWACRDCVGQIYIDQEVEND